MSYVLQNQQIALGGASPEKAGVGGSTPSLATKHTANQSFTSHY